MLRTQRVTVAIGLFLNGLASWAYAAEPATSRVVPFYGYSRAIELTRGSTRAVLCPEVGGRVLEFSVGGKDAMFLEDSEKSWQPGKPAPASAGRFDYGPELTVLPHRALWSGEWSGEMTGPSSARLTSPRDEGAGIQLVREFELASGGSDDAGHLICRQMIRNIGNEVREVCHWGRSFSPGGGICVIPLGDRPSRFPSRYAMYEESAIINVRNKDDKIRERDGFLEILAPPRKPKLGFDTTGGWLGYLMPNDTVFVKRFKTFPDRVYNEAAGLTLSVWYPTGPRIELEPIGPRERLRPGESASFVEDWWLFPFPFPKEGEQADLKSLNSLVTSRPAIVADNAGASRAVRKTIPDKLVVLTFDDSAKSHHTFVRPLLKEHGFGATFFITEGFDFPTNKKDYMTWEQIKELHDDGFEIGNHTRDHLGISDKTVERLPEQLQAIADKCREQGIPEPVTFAWPGNAMTPAAFATLKKHGIRFARRGGSPEYPYDEGRGFAFEPGLDHPFMIPSAGDGRPKWTLPDFIRAVEQARNGRIAVLQFHGVPDTAHDWVSSTAQNFEAYMKYLKVEGYRVIALRDLQELVDPDVAPDDYRSVIETRRESLKAKTNPR